MGYHMHQREACFHIKPENRAEALAAIKSLAGSETIRGPDEHHFAWVSTKAFMRAETLEDAMAEWRWNLQINDDEMLTELYFDGEKYGDDDILFGAIAPFVEPGCYVEMQGEDGAIWRWAFDGKTCDKKEAKIVWD